VTSTVPAPGLTRKELGSWYTPAPLVDLLVERTITDEWLREVTGGLSRPVRVLDPACGDGRLLRAARTRVEDLGGTTTLTGVEIDPGVAAATMTSLGRSTEIMSADALQVEWGTRRFDLVLGNPPFRSQLARHTTRGGASRHGGGPYADTAVEFLSLAVQLADDRRGRVALVLPQSLLSSRDAAPVRADVDRRATHLWSWWSPRRYFDAEVVVCAVAVERHLDRRPPSSTSNAAPFDTQRPGAGDAWSHVVTEALGIPPLPDICTDGSVGNRATLNANFRDEYYGLVPAVIDGGDGPPLVTSGLIDPGQCRWGHQPVRFAKRWFDAPRVELERLDPKMTAWARRKLVPKVLVASQTAVVEAVADHDGAWLPGVPVTSVVPDAATTVLEVAAVLTSPITTAAAWSRTAGTGLSATTMRLGPTQLAALPWPAGPLDPALEALVDGDVPGCGLATLTAYGLPPDHPIGAWWIAMLTRGRGASPPHRPMS